MPKLLVFAACEKAILDENGLLSLITLVERMEVSVPKDLEIQPQTAIRMRWNVATVWALNNDEIGQYEQMTHLVTEDGTIAMHAGPQKLESRIPGFSTGVKIISELDAVPITDGPLALKLYCRKIGEQNWNGIAEYPISVVIRRQ